MSHGIAEWIRDAIAACGVDAVEAEPAVATQIVQDAARRFVSGVPRAWWLSLAQPSRVFSSNETTLAGLIPENSAHCWLIGESESDVKPVFEVLSADASKIINECPFFEYYLVAKDFSWLLAESDHNEYYLCLSAVP